MPTFNILIASIGRESVKNMLYSLKNQLTEQDCITLVFDGVIPNFEIDTSDYLCKVYIYYETTNLGYWGHGIRNKYNPILEKRDFVLHADDDDIYLTNSFKLLRRDCADKNCLYVAKMNFRPWEDRCVPETNEIKIGNIGTPCGIIPYKLNIKGKFGEFHGGDFLFYESISRDTSNIIFFDHIIYQIRSLQILDVISKKYKLDKNIASGCHNYIPGYTSLFEYLRYEVHNMLEIGIGSIENGQMSGVVYLGYKTGNSLKCWAEYFPNSKIYGIDIYGHPELNTDKITTFVADQSNALSLQNVIKNINTNLDVIIDDGSHNCEHQVFSFMFLNQYLSKNGIYVIEDIQPQNIDKFIDLSIFPKFYINYIKDNFDIKYFDTRQTYNRADDFMMAFIRK
jgi:hypothetical protein